MRRHVLCLALLLTFVVSCGQEGVRVIRGPEEDGKGTISFTTSALLGDVFSYYRIRFYEGPPKGWPDDKPYFYSPCDKAVSSGFTITNLKTGANFAIVFEGYSASDCSLQYLTAVGLRGDVRITSEGTGQAFYYIQLNRVGSFTSFPVPGPDLNPSSGGLQCKEDADCQGYVKCEEWEEDCPGGLKYNFHPKATCVDGICRLTTLFPLNMRSPRAFHQTFETSLGVLEVGGFSKITAEAMESSGVGDEFFSANTSLFSGPELSGLDTDLALAASTFLPKLGIGLSFGGATRLRMGVLATWLRPKEIPCPKGKCAADLSSMAVVVDASRKAVTVYTLPLAMAGGVAYPVELQDGSVGILVRPDYIQEDKTKIIVSDRAYLFLLGEDGSLSCADPEADEDPSDKVLSCKPISGLTPRAGFASTCLTEGPSSACKQVAFLGGHSKDDGLANFGDLFDGNTKTFMVLEGDPGLPKALDGARAFLAGSRIFTVGGLAAGGDNAGIYAFSVDLGTNKVHQASVVSSDDLSGLKRIYHQVTPFADGKRFLVTGGYRGEEVLKSYLLLEVEGEKVRLISSGDMATPRLGHGATLVASGVLKGAVLVTGGLSSLGDHPTFASSAEIFLPPR